MAFDPDEISTLHYSEYSLSDRPKCPNGQVVMAKTMSRRMTWSDLHGNCATIKPGITYHSDFLWGDFFTDG
jgi:hypothetical protein